MGRFQDYLDAHEEQFEQEVREYAEFHKVSLAEARRDVRDEWCEGWCDGEAARRTTDWDYGRE